MPTVRVLCLPEMATNLQPGRGCTAIAGTAETPMPAATMARMVANCPLSKATLAGRNLASLNAKLIQMERGLTDPEGLPRRPWFRHQLYAPGFYTGYGVKTIPAVREAIEQKQWAEAETQIARVGKVLQNEARMLDAAAAELSK